MANNENENVDFTVNYINKCCNAHCCILNVTDEIPPGEPNCDHDHDHDHAFEECACFSTNFADSSSRMMESRKVATTPCQDKISVCTSTTSLGDIIKLTKAIADKVQRETVDAITSTTRLNISDSACCESLPGSSSKVADHGVRRAVSSDCINSRVSSRACERRRLADIIVKQITSIQDVLTDTCLANDRGNLKRICVSVTSTAEPTQKEALKNALVRSMVHAGQKSSAADAAELAVTHILGFSSTRFTLALPSSSGVKKKACSTNLLLYPKIKDTEMKRSIILKKDLDDVPRMDEKTIKVTSLTKTVEDKKKEAKVKLSRETQPMPRKDIATVKKTVDVKSSITKLKKLPSVIKKDKKPAVRSPEIVKAPKVKKSRIIKTPKVAKKPSKCKVKIPQIIKPLSCSKTPKVKKPKKVEKIPQPAKPRIVKVDKVSTHLSLPSSPSRVKCRSYDTPPCRIPKRVCRDDRIEVIWPPKLESRCHKDVVPCNIYFQKAKYRNTSIGSCSTLNSKAMLHNGSLSYVCYPLPQASCVSTCNVNFRSVVDGNVFSRSYNDCAKRRVTIENSSRSSLYHDRGAKYYCRHLSGISIDNARMRHYCQRADSCPTWNDNGRCGRSRSYYWAGENLYFTQPWTGWHLPRYN